MKILAFVDIHLSKKHYLTIKNKAENVDLILCAGDMTIFGDGMDFMLRKFNQIGKPMLIIHGNHEDGNKLKRNCKRYKNLEFIHKEVKIIDNIGVIGYGGGGFSSTDVSFTKFGKKISSIMKLNKNMKFILMTHAPPYKTKLDAIADSNCGNKSYKNFIIKAKPDYVIAGHIHENFNKSEQLGKTLIMNPGPSGRIIRI